MFKRSLRKKLILTLFLSLVLAGSALGGSPKFGESGDVINLGDIDLSGATELTICMWAEVDTDDFDGTVHLIAADCNGNTLTDDGFWLALDDRNSAGGPRDGFQAEFATAFYPYVEKRKKDDVFTSTPTWYHLCAAYGSNTLNLYVNGSDVNASLAAGTDGSGNYTDGGVDNHVIGAADDLSSYTAVGTSVSEYSVWTKKLSANEIANLANPNLRRKPLETQPSSLKVYLPLDDRPIGESGLGGDTFADMSGNGNDGTGVDADNDSTVVGGEPLSYPPGVM